MQNVMSTRILSSIVAVVGVLAVAGVSRGVAAQQAASVAIDADDLGGVVTGPKGPEAGVWVIAETAGLPTPYAKIVVTDEQGRYLVPDLPKARYKVFVRGYGLVDSPRVDAAPGQRLDLKAVPAPSAAAAAEYYPANYWFSLLEVPKASEFPGTGPQGNGIGTGMRSQSDWIAQVKSGCVPCHQLGNKATREIPESLGRFADSVQAWDRRTLSGQQGGQMTGMLNAFGRQKALGLFAAWSDRISRGALPPVPPRPQGKERNVVITQWDWSDPVEYIHDLTSTDRRNPRLNAYGKVYSNNRYNSPDLNELDPVRNTVRRVATVPLRDQDKRLSAGSGMPKPSPYWSEELIWKGRGDVHNPMMDHKGRVWVTSAIRGAQNPDFCKAGSSHPSAKYFPLNTSGRQVAVYDPKTEKVTTVNTCFSTHHLVFDDDADNTLWSGTGYIKTRQFDETGDEAGSQGWIPFILDTNGNGKADAWVERSGQGDSDDPEAATRPGAKQKVTLAPDKDLRINGGSYGLAASPVDDAMWGISAGGVYRWTLGKNPPQSALGEWYALPPGAAGFEPRGGDVDRNGVVWAGLQSGHLASFDRRKCKVLRGPQVADGQHCPEGWSFYKTPGPGFVNAESSSADMHYYAWVDQFNTLGLGANVPMVMGSNSDSTIAFLPETREMVVIRMPYPLGFFTRLGDGRIDDEKIGWKGRGLWQGYSLIAPWHMEGGKGTRPRAVHIQYRPTPLAK